MLCICSPAGQEKFFMKLGVAVASRTATPPARPHGRRLKRKLKHSLHNTERNFWYRDPDRASRLSRPGRWKP
jgi:hypothetical protein